MASNLIQKNLRRWFAASEPIRPSAFLVGGAVRDHLLKRPSNDLDLACRDAEGVAARLAAACAATVVRFDKKRGETCFRIIARGDRPTVLDLVELQGDDIVGDLARRDFTINAMAMRIHPGGRLGKLIDPHHGWSDLQKGIVRMVGPDAFAHDPLRILRAWRFAGELGYRIDTATRNHLAVHAPNLNAVAVERTVYELFRILSLADAGRFVREMALAGVLDPLFPEKAGPRQTAAQFGIWDPCLAVVEGCESVLLAADEHFEAAGPQVIENISAHNRLPVFKLAALFYDIAQSGKGAAEKLAGAIARRLKLSSRDRAFFQGVLAGLSDIFKIVAAGQTDRSQLIGFFRTLGDDGLAAVVLGLAVAAEESVPFPAGIDRQKGTQNLQLAAIDYHKSIKAKLAESDLICGTDLLALGLTPGRRLGALLREVRRAQDEGVVASREQALDMARKRVNGMGKGD